MISEKIFLHSVLDRGQKPSNFKFARIVCPVAELPRVPFLLKLNSDPAFYFTFVTVNVVRVVTSPVQYSCLFTLRSIQHKSNFTELIKYSS